MMRRKSSCWENISCPSVDKLGPLRQGRCYEQNGALSIKGEQKSEKNDDYVTINGIVTKVGAGEFTFTGTIITKISYINGGKPCKREGEMTFRITGKRRYWRLVQMDNPCDQATDYVDIYLR